MGRMLASFTPRFTTMLILTGLSPAAAAASIPSSTTSTGKPTSFIAWKTALSTESRLTVIRRSPAAFSAAACWAKSAPFVVSVRSRSGMLASRAISRSRLRRSSGSPPVTRIFSTPRAWKSRARRSISSNVRSCPRSRKGWSRPKTSFGMQ